MSANPPDDPNSFEHRINSYHEAIKSEFLTSNQTDPNNPDATTALLELARKKCYSKLLLAVDELCDLALLCSKDTTKLRALTLLFEITGLTNNPANSPDNDPMTKLLRELTANDPSPT